MTVDPGMRCGYAIGRGAELLAYGTIYAKDYEQITEEMKELVETYKPQRLILEDWRGYNTDIKAKHKTPIVIGIVLAVYKCIANGPYELVLYNSWSARFKRAYFTVFHLLPEEWKKALEGGSEHSRDAVAMLLAYTNILEFRRKKREQEGPD